MPDALAVLGCEIIFLQTLDPLGCLPFQIPKAQHPGQSGVVGAQVELLPIQVLVKMLQGFQNSQQLLTSYTIVPLGLEQGFTEVSYNPFATILHLRQHTPNPHVAGIGVDDKLFRWLRVAQNRCCAQCFFQGLEGGLCFCGLLKYSLLFSKPSQRLGYVSKYEPRVVRA